MKKMEKTRLQGRNTGYWLTGIASIAKHINVGKTTVSNLINAGQLPGIRKFGGQWLIRNVDIDSFILYRKPFRKLTKPQRQNVLFGVEGGRNVVV